MAGLKLSDFDFSDLHDYPNVGKDKKGNIVEFSYDGNGLIRTYKDQLYITPEAREEWKKCKEDKLYFFKEYVKIQTIDDGIISFEPRDYQLEFFDLIEGNSKVVGVLPRQSGKTVGMAASVVWDMCFLKSKNIGYVANAGDLKAEFVAMVQAIYELLPPWLQRGVKKWNTGSIELEMKMKLVSAIAGPRALRGKTIWKLIGDELAFVDPVKLDGFFDSAFPALSSGKNTKTIIISTPNGFNKFEELVREAKEDINGFKAYHIDYTRVPGRDEAWREDEIKSNGPLKFMRNHACQFIGSSPTLLNAQTLEKLTKGKKPPIDSLDDVAPDIKIYEMPEEGYDYVIGVDSSKASATAGIEVDYISAQVVKIDRENSKLKQVVTLRTKDIHYMELADIVNELGIMYNDALVIVENNEGAGQSTADHLFDTYEYENLYSNESRNDINGFRTTKKTKSTGLSNLKKLIESEILEVIDHDTITEFMTFIRNGYSFSAQKGMHDDTVMALCISLYFLLDENNELELTMEELLKKEVVQVDREREDTESVDFMGTNKTKSDLDDAWLVSEQAS